MGETDPQELSDELERQAATMRGQSERLGEEVESVRADWERKRQDPKIPGAPPREDPGEDEAESEQEPETPPF